MSAPPVRVSCPWRGKEMLLLKYFCAQSWILKSAFQSQSAHCCTSVLVALPTTSFQWTLPYPGVNSKEIGSGVHAYAGRPEHDVIRNGDDVQDAP